MLRTTPLVVLILFLVSCATNPVTGRQEVSLMSPEREASVGKEAAAQVEREIGLVNDPKLLAYVRQIGQRLAAHSPRKDVAYQFYIADMPEPNAFALPGGYIYVSRGLLALANTEDELAGVIGHEIGHVAARHSAQRETRQAGVGILAALGTIAAGVVGGAEAAQAVSQMGQVAGAGLIASYSRDQERQADQIGQDLEAAAGWDPEGLADFLAALERESTLQTGKQRRASFLDSHPQPGERAVVARGRAAELPRGAEARIAKGRPAFLQRITGVVVGPNPEEGIFRENVFVHPGLGFAMTFPPKWRTQNAKEVVAAASERRDAVLMLESQGASGDPKSAAQRWVQANRVNLADGGPLKIGGWSAYRGLAQAQTKSGVVAVDVTWIAHPSGTYRVTALTSPNSYRNWAPTFERTATSFRAITPAERASAKPRRLRVATARAGESLEALGARTGNRWSVPETAVSNGLSKDARLSAGQLVKIAAE
jgi:predicted Zn-dependent protease